VLTDYRTAPISEKLRQVCAFLEKVTREPAAVAAADVEALKRLGLSRKDVEDALLVAFCFNLIVRLADAFGWKLPSPEEHKRSAKFLLSKGYVLPFSTVR
jgi:alkylhydroperoxidase family enzyme